MFRKGLGALAQAGVFEGGVVGDDRAGGRQAGAQGGEEGRARVVLAGGEELVVGDRAARLLLDVQRELKGDLLT